MPRYYFHVFDGHSALDDEGTELRDTHQAEAEALSLATALLREMGSKFWNGREWRLEVADERKQVLFVLRFSAEERLPPSGAG